MQSSIACKNHEHKLLLFLWELIIRTILNPIFNHNNRTSIPRPGEEFYLSPMLSAHRFDKRLFPCIHERLPRFISDYYTEHVLAHLRNQTDGFHMVTSLQESWFTCAYKTSLRLEENLRPLEDAYRQVVQDFQFIPIRKVVIEQFRTSVYDKLLGSVQRFGFSCISKDGIITNRDGIWFVQMLIETVSNDTMIPCTAEWDTPVMAWIFESIEDTINSWTASSVKSFLRRVSFRLLEYRSIFMYKKNEFEAKRRFLQAVSVVRDKLIFNNDTNLRNMLQDEESAPELQQLIYFFHDDQKFLQVMSERSGEYFKEFLVGENHESDMELLRNEGFFRRFMLTWKRMHSITRKITTKRAFAEAVLAPLTCIIGNCSNYAKIWHTQKFLAQHCHSLLSQNGTGKQILPTSKEEEIFEIVSLAGYMRSTDAFVEAHRFLLSKRLLTDTSECPQLEDEVVQVLSKHHSDLFHGIKLILSDAKQWSLYQGELFGTSRDQHDDLLVKPKVVNRTYWFLEEDVGLVLNPQLQMISNDISAYFKSNYPHRCCSVHSTAGHAIIRTNIWGFEGNSVRIKLTTAQLSMLSLFEKSKKLSVKQICTLLLNIDDNSGKEFLLKLIRSMMGTNPVLRKEPNARNIIDTDMISLNKDFQTKEMLITLPIPEAPKKNTIQSDDSVFEETEETLREFRKQYFETVIVKVLKERKVVDLNMLNQLVFSAGGLKLTLDDDIFEKTVATLEKRDFLTVDGKTVRYLP